jgi:heme a synthase
MNKKFFQKYSWALVGYVVLVILWGAVVRATGSGAGCGSHWPLCNGEVIPQLARVDTVIELIHRISSSLAGLFVIALAVMAYRLYGRRSKVTVWAFLALVFIVVEGLLGRLLVVKEWVVDDASAIRAVVVAIHLANTYILLLTLSATAWLAGIRHEIRMRGNRFLATLVFIGMTMGILLSAMGAVTALGDTLFPPESMFWEAHEAVDATSHFLIRLRVYHPIMAILTGGYLVAVVRYIQRKDLGGKVNFRGNFLIGAILIQVLAGGFNVLTLAPLAMQVIHLMLADIFWISLVLFALETLTVPIRKGE